MPLRRRGSLAGVEQRLLLRLDGLRHALLGLFQRVERLGASQHVGVVFGALRHAARGQPVVESLALGLAFAARLAALQLRLLQRGLRLLLGLARRLDLCTQLYRLGAVQEIIHLQRCLDLGEVAHNGSAQTDQETCKHQCHQPQATAEPFFGQAQ